MTLPIIIDIAIGLVFIYLSLSLLVSGINELIASLVEWRSKHLKEAIKNLFCPVEDFSETEAGDLNEKTESAIDFLYKSTLIKGMRQDQRGWWPHSGKYPSYIDSNDFSSGLLKATGFTELVRCLTEIELAQFCERQLKIFKDIEITEQFKEKISKVEEAFGKGNISLSDSIKQIEKVLREFLEHKFDSSGSEYEERLNLIDETFAFEKREFLLRDLQPSPLEVIGELKEIVGVTTKELTRPLSQDGSDGLKAAINRLATAKEEIKKRLPKPVVNSLEALAERAQTNAKGAAVGVYELQQEVEMWFDNSMKRASGVYKRENQLVAFIIGLIVALFINIDTFHIVNELSTDSDLRNILVEEAIQADGNSNIDKLEKQLNKFSLPIGWGSENRKQQFNFSSVRSSLFSLKALLGWLISALAIHMGAPFWFDLLDRIINVRSTGPKPKSTVKPQNNNSQEQ